MSVLYENVHLEIDILLTWQNETPFPSKQFIKILVVL